MGGVKAAAEPDPFAAINHLAHQGCATYGPSRQGTVFTRVHRREGPAGVT